MRRGGCRPWTTSSSDGTSFAPRASRGRGRGRAARRHAGPARRADRHGARLLRVLRLRVRSPTRNVLRAQALWSRVLDQHDIDWVGEMHRLADSPGFERVIERAESSVSYPDDDVDAATAGFESMEFWGEQAAIWAPIVYGDQVLGMLELTEKERERTVHQGTTTGSCARWPVARRRSRCTTRALARAAEERNRQLSALIGASRAMTSTLDLDELLEVICRHAALALDAAELHLRVRRRGDAMVWLAEYQRDAAHAFEEPLGTVYPLDDLPQDLTVVRTAGRSRCASTTPTSSDVMRRLLLDWGEMSSLMVPLLVGGQRGRLARGERGGVPAPLQRAGGRPLRGARRAGGRGHPQRPALPAAPASRRRPSSGRPPSTASPASSTTAASGSGCATRSRGPRGTASRSRC